MLYFTLLLAFSLLQQPTEAARIIEFRAPDSVPHHPGATVEFFCRTEGTPSWKINGSVDLFSNLLGRGFTFSSASVSTSPPQFKLNMTVEVAGNNNTDIACVAISKVPEVPGDSSRTVTIHVAGPPLPPSPALRVVNATHLQLSWEEPFTSEGFGIKQYNISVRRSNNIQALVNITNRIFDWRIEGIAQSCEELLFTVTAINDIGDSEAANVSGEFPIAPGPFISPVDYEVTFFSDGQPRLEVCFSPPQICRSQNSSFIITVQKLDENGDTDTVYTEEPVRYTNGSGAERRVISSELEINQIYLLTVHFSTVAGDSNSSATFTTGPSHSTSDPDSPGTSPPVTDGPDRSNKTLIIIISAVVGACTVVLLLGIMIVAAFTYLQRKAKRNERHSCGTTDSTLEMVPNPIYEGPVYDIINDSTELQALPNTRAQESSYVDIPPSVAPRQNRENGHHRSYGERKLSEMDGANGALATSPEETYTFMKPVGAVKGYEELRHPTDKENRYVLETDH